MTLKEAFNREFSKTSHTGFIQLMEAGGFLHALDEQGRVWRLHDPALGGIGWLLMDMTKHESVDDL